MMNEEKAKQFRAGEKKVHDLKRARMRPFYESQQPHKGIVDKIEHNYVNRSADVNR